MKRLLGWAVAVALLATMGLYRTASGDTPTVVPDFTYKDLDGKSVSFYSLKGKAYVVDLWATWCAPCKKEIPDLIALQHKYEKQGLKVIGIAMDDEGASVVKPFVQQNKMDYTILVGDVNTIGNVFGDVQTIPDTYFIDGQHRLHAALKEYHGAADLEKNVQDLLAGK